MNIVTAGSEFLDIDAYACMVALAELLNKNGEQAVAVSTAPWNDSVTPVLRALGQAPLTTYQPTPEDVFMLVDISEPAFFDKIVNPEKVVAVIDHHVGFERYWQDKIGDGANIDFIGAACTLVYEEWVKAGKIAEMSQATAQLLLAGILDNTLNFNASITTERDHVAYRALLPIAEVDELWVANYFQDCQGSIEADLRSAIKNDTKTIFDTTKLPKTFAQLVLWNANEFIVTRKDEIIEILDSMNADWMLNLIAIEEGYSYFLAKNPETQAKIGTLMDVKFVDDIAVTDRLYLRKEILKKAQA